MAGGNVFAESMSCVGILEAASPSLQNCIQFSNSGRYFSALCDFGIVSVCELKGKKLFYGGTSILRYGNWDSKIISLNRDVVVKELPI